MAKRRNGEGSWGKKKVGKTIYHYFRDSSGNYTYGRTLKEVKEKYEKKSNKKLVIDNKTTFGRYILNWLENVKKRNIEAPTYDCYETIIHSQIINFKEYDLANKQLHNITPEVLQEYVDTLANKYAHSTIKKTWAIIRQCVEYGEIKGVIQQNSMFGVAIPIEANVKVKKKEIAFLPEEDMEKLYDVLNYQYMNGAYRYKNSANAHVVIFIMYSGMRVSEAVAFKWKDYDAKNKKAHVKNSAAIIKNREENADKKYISYDKSAKTKDSERTIPLPNRAVEMIEWFDKRNPKHKKDDYVFLNNNMSKLNRRNVNRTLVSMARDAQCSTENFSVHSLRHTYGSYLLSKGVDIKIVSELLGHSNVAFTYDVYIGILDKDKKKNVKRVFDGG